MLSDIPLSDEDRRRLNIMRRAIAAGTYQISPHDVAAKLLLSTLGLRDDSRKFEETSSSEAEAEEKNG
jgi:Anti-sigma-28 factor, FlgM